MKKKVFLPILFVAVLLSATTGFLAGQRHQITPEQEAHIHQWGQWGDPDPDENNSKNAQFIQFRRCTNCGLAEFRVVLEGK